VVGGWRHGYWAVMPAIACASAVALGPFGVWTTLHYVLYARCAGYTVLRAARYTVVSIYMCVCGSQAMPVLRV
jgi:hypothetical protein